MKKQYVTIIVLLVLLAAIVAGNRVISCVSEKKQAEIESQSEAESIASTILVTDLDDVSKITIGELSFEKNSDTWVYSGDNTFPLDTDKITSICTELETLTSSRELIDGDTLSAYGLDQPEYTIVLENSSGDTQTITIGSAVDSEYYVKTDKEDTIYTCTFSTMSDWSDELLDYAAIEDTSSVWSSNPTSIELSMEDNNLLLTSTKSDEEDTTTWNASIDGEEAYECTNSTQLSSALEDFALTYTQCLGYNVTEDQYLKYGLDEPLYTLTISYLDDDEKECAITYYVGDYNSDDSTYAIISSNSKQVYSIAKTQIDNLETVLNYDFIETQEDETTAE